MKLATRNTSPRSNALGQLSGTPSRNPAPFPSVSNWLSPQSPCFALSIHAPRAGILYHEQMALLLDIWSALVLGVLYLTFQAFPIIFGQVHGWSVQFTGLSFLGLGVGMVCALASQPYWIA